MTQVIINGERIGYLTQENARVFMRLNRLTVVSQTEFTINLEK